MSNIPQMNLPKEARPWGRAIQTLLTQLVATDARRNNDSSRVNKAQNSTAVALGIKVANITAAFTSLISTASIAASQITAGTFGPGVILPTANLNGNLTAPDVFATNAPTNVFTGTRVAGWLLSATGQLGTATSTEAGKTDISPTTMTGEQVLAANIVQWEYLAEIAKTQADPTYHSSLNFGTVAEQLHAAGLWQLVVYQRNDDGTATLDDSGNPIPIAVHDILSGWAAILAAQSLDARITALEGASS